MVVIAPSREDMKSNPFAPLAGSVSHEAVDRQTFAMEYIAFYLGEIDKHLAAIAVHSASGSTSSTQIAAELKGLAHVLPTLLKR